MYNRASGLFCFAYFPSVGVIPAFRFTATTPSSLAILLDISSLLCVYTQMQQDGATAALETKVRQCLVLLPLDLCSLGIKRSIQMHPGTSAWEHTRKDASLLEPSTSSSRTNK